MAVGSWRQEFMSLLPRQYQGLSAMGVWPLLLTSIDGEPLCEHTYDARLAKRALDILLAALALVVASTFMAVTAIAIKLYDHGPALYKQVRLTKDGREFEILKFRSMRVDAEKDGVARLAAEHDNRITPVGKVIRAVA